MSDQTQLHSDRFVLVGPLMKERLLANSLDHLGLESVPHIAVDGGDRFAFQPALVVGDGDSSGVIPPSAPWIKKISMNETDLGFALQFLSTQLASAAWKDLHLFGFLGLRRDHELAVIGELLKTMKERPHRSIARVYDDSLQLEFSVHNSGNHVFDHVGLFSVLSLEPSTMSLNGDCVYHLKEQTMQPLSGRGVSNEGNGRFTVTSSGVFMMIPQKAIS